MIFKGKVFVAYLVLGQFFFTEKFNMESIIAGIIFLAVIQCIEGAYNMTEYVIRPPTMTHRGAIGAGRVCPPNTVAKGFRMKIQVPDDADEM